MALSLIIPTGIGYWLDRPEMFDRRPMFTLIGLGIGTVIAFYGLVRMLRRYKAEQNELNKDKK
jgi:F0F1-type ATP synthase assembly protein I